MQANQVLYVIVRGNRLVDTESGFGDRATQEQVGLHQLVFRRVFRLMTCVVHATEAVHVIEPIRGATMVNPKEQTRLHDQWVHLHFLEFIDGFPFDNYFYRFGRFGTATAQRVDVGFIITDVV
ncbi:hypothetical protein D3C78_1390850 [compost metagenome]